MCIDPGTSTLGLAYIEVDLSNITATITHAETLNSEKVLRKNTHYQQVAEDKGNRYAKQLSHQNRLSSKMVDYDPHEIVVESPFMGNMSHAFGALVECVSSIRRAVSMYNITVPMIMVAPHEAKKSVNSLKEGYGKDETKKAVFHLINDSKHSGLYTDIDLGVSDEHVLDAIAVGYTRVIQWFDILEAQRKKGMVKCG